MASCHAMSVTIVLRDDQSGRPHYAFDDQERVEGALRALSRAAEEEIYERRRLAEEDRGGSREAGEEFDQDGGAGARPFTEKAITGEGAVLPAARQARDDGRAPRRPTDVAPSDILHVVASFVQKKPAPAFVRLTTATLGRVLGDLDRGAYTGAAKTAVARLAKHLRRLLATFRLLFCRSRSIAARQLPTPNYARLKLQLRVHGEFVNYVAIGIWNRPRQWCRHT
jgi:hypothetical protein